MFRPATPLAVLLFAAFALLVLSVLSTPVIKAIPLGSFQGINFGVFGYCKSDGSCSPFELGYDTSSLYSSTDSATFDLPASARHTLSSILILHPIAAFLTLVMFAMAFAAHFHSPSHSVRYLLFVFIISIFTFLAALLAFLIDVLLFVPHMAWGSFITLAAACLIAISSVVSCAMRRTLVSRKSRQRRIDDNAEMSGENFYNRQAQEDAVVSASKVTTGSSTIVPSRQPTLPQVDTPTGNGDSFEKRDDLSSDEQVPLTSRTVPPAQRYGQSPVRSDRYGAPRRQDTGNMMSGGAGGPPRRPSRPDSVQRDGYGNPLPYSSSRTPPPMDGYGGSARRGPSAERMNNLSPSRGRGGAPYRGGRGGPAPYGAQGRGAYGPGRGGYGPSGRSGTGGGYGAGYSGPMPPNGRGRAYGGPVGRGGFSGGPNRGGRTPPPGYQYDQSGSYGARGQSPGPQSGPGAYFAANNTTPSGAGGSYEPYRDRTVSGDLPRAESPPPLSGDPISPAVEMDAGVPGNRQQGGRFGDDDEIAGMVGLQQGRTANTVPERASENMDGQYVPARAAWNRPGANSPSRPVAAELSSSEAPAPRPRNSGQYIEDVDPRFAEPVQPRQQAQPLLSANNSYEDVHQGSRSPAESDRSNFTSISQRGINPRWNPPPPNLMPGYSSGGGGGGGQIMPRRPVRDVNESLLNSNPDFSLPTGRQPSGNLRGAVGGGGGGAYPGL